MKKWWLLLATVCLGILVAVWGAAAETVSGWTEMVSLVNGGGNTVSVTLGGDVVAGRNDTVLMIPAGKTVTISLNGHTLSRGTVGICDGNYMIHVSSGGSLTIQGTGTVTDVNAEGTRHALIHNEGTFVLDGPALCGNSLCVENTGTVRMESGSMVSEENGAVSISGENPTFVLNGGSLNGMTPNYASVGVITLSGGSFVMNGGEIKNNTGCPAVWNDGGSVTVNGGEISGNHCEGDFGFGCVYGKSGGFTMTGGVISGNSGRNAGAVYVSTAGTFTMTGGSITGNTGYPTNSTSRTGGVFCGGTTTVSGNIQITGNYRSDSGVLSTANLCLSPSKKLVVDGPLAADTRIGLSPGMNTISSQTAITSGLSTKGVNDVPYGTQANVTIERQPASGVIVWYEGEYVGMPSVSVSFDANGGTGTMAAVNVVSGIPWTLPACTLTPPAEPDGTVFEGWYFDGSLHQPGEEITPTGSMTLQARWLSPWGALRKQIEAANTSQTFEYFTLDRDIAAASWDQYITLKNNQRIHLNLAGHTMDASAIPSVNGYFFHIGSGANLNLVDTVGGGKLTGALSNEYYPIENEGALFFTGGSICGNFKGGIRTYGNSGSTWLQGGTVTGNGLNNDGYNEGIGVVLEGGSLHMSAGEISGNKGTGVEILNGCTFFMSGGSITNNGSYGIYGGSAGFLNLSGGTITGNVTGVYTHSVSLAGMVTISGNTNRDVYLLDNWKLKFTGPLDADARIGVWVPQPCTFTYGLKTNNQICAVPGNFFSNREEFIIGKESRELIIAVGVRISFDANGGTGSMATVTVPGGSNWQLPACTLTPPARKVFSEWEINGTRYFSNATVTISTSTTVKALWKTPDVHGTWAELQAQIDEGVSPVTIQLDKDMYGDAEDPNDRLVIPAGKTVTIDLNGYTIDRHWGDTDPHEMQSITVQKGASLTILDSYEEQTGRITMGKACQSCILNCGTLTLESGILEGNYNNVIWNQGLFTMNGGTITGNGLTNPGQQGDTAVGVVNFDMAERDAQMIMNGGSITGNKGYGIWNYDSLTLNDGTISENTHGGITTYEDSTTTINGGTISGNGYILYSNGKVSQLCYGGGLCLYDGTVTMTDGVISGNKGDYAVRVGKCALTVTGGSIKNNQAGGIGCIGGQLSIGGEIEFGGNVCPDNVYSCDIYAGQLPIHIVEELDENVSMIIRLAAYPADGQWITITDGYLDGNGNPQADPRSFICRDTSCSRAIRNGEIAFGIPLACEMDAADFVLPADIREIGTDAFAGITAEVVYIPDVPEGETLTIRSGAFKNCTALRQIRIPENAVFEDGAFEGCSDVVVFGTAGGTAEQLALVYGNAGFLFAEEND